MFNNTVTRDGLSKQNRVRFSVVVSNTILVSVNQTCSTTVVTKSTRNLHVSRNVFDKSPKRSNLRDHFRRRLSLKRLATPPVKKNTYL